VLLAVLVLGTSCGRSGSALPHRPQTVDVDMREYRFDRHGAIRPGRTVIRARNQGHLVHELVLIYLEPTVPPLDRQLHSSERLVVPTIVSLHARAPGRTGTFAVDLEAGRYAFICFVQDPDGVQHALKGMNSEFRVG
jgi:hypothetical protein